MNEYATGTKADANYALVFLNLTAIDK